ncbi:hypothetical protein EDM57_04445 [Brevibacillus gelatini]|uniref:DNA methyltransferase n=1 Tax=Brevibacillus gelatini TaxID=1655277 RepID=A0A3M8B8T2_9BACL|nr:hypothetical protein [Brevibacillus gelatini]RNB59397.1 hypothetical protein EDM57_04445 [Brevibacillus gelatini]
MSAKNRGAKTKPFDFYPTPIDVVDKLLIKHKIQDGTILEPCAGNGVIIKSLRNYGYTNKIIANEIRKEEESNLIHSGADEITYDDFLLKYEVDKSVKTVITNPPFTYAKEFLEQCFKLYPNAEIIMLLRLAFLESKKRYEFWQQHPVSKLYVLSERPSFTGEGTDATAYAWFVWNEDYSMIEVV